MLNRLNSTSVTSRELAGGSFASRLQKIKGIVTLGIVTVLMGACNSPPEPEATVPANPNIPTSTVPATQNTPTATIPTNTSVNKVADNTSQLIGQTVTVNGEVEEVVGTNAFRIEDQQLFNNEEVLVINATSATPITEDNKVKVTGTVRQFVLAEFERDYNLKWNGEIAKKLEAEYQNKPVIVAQTVEKMAEN